MSSPQDSLFDPLQAPPPRHRLFFALVPPEAVRERIAAIATSLRAREVLKARWVRPARYHLTLAFLGDHVALGEALLAAARAAGDALAAQCTPFTWRADRIDSFRGRQPPCVLRGADGPEMQALWSTLRHELARRALDGQLDRSFAPHVTLAYAERVLAAPLPLDPPLEWPVDGFELLHGELGRHDYRPLGHWRLAG